MKKRLIKISKKIFVPKNNYEQFAKKVYQVLVENFQKTFFVGGMVRDLFLKKDILDIDIVTAGRPEKVKQLLEKEGFELDLKGMRFGVIGINYKNRQIEVTSLRTETYKSNRFPSVKFTNSVDRDSKRRDFTINSLYFQANLNEVYDPNGGLLDLKKRIMRVIGKPSKRLIEDPLRIARAYRLSKQLNFNFDSDTKEALQNNFHLLSKLSNKKLLSEIKKSKSKSTEIYLTKLFEKLLQKK